MKCNLLLGVILSFSFWICTVQCEKQDADQFDQRDDEGTNTDTDSETSEVYQLNLDSQAIVTNVIATGSDNNYTFQVTISSPDLGCDQYADWWEVFTPDSNLVYRRILAHSHVNEQPFTRSGGAVPIEADAEVYIRAHMNNLSYGSLIFSGSVEGGFSPDTIAVTRAGNLETVDPLPTNCAF